jgi:hypothetical protein
MKTKFVASLALPLLLVTLMPVDVAAQLVGSDSPPPASMRRPYRGLFGDPGDPETPQSLILSASLFGAYDDNVTTGVTGRQTFDPRLQRSGSYYGATAGLNYSLAKSLQRASFDIASGVSASGYRLDSDNNIVPHAHVAGNLSYLLGRRTAVTLSPRVVYSRYYRFMLFPSLLGFDDDGALAGSPDTELFERTALRYGASVGFSHGFDARSSLSATYMTSFVDYQDGEFEDWRMQGAGINFDRRLTANATLQLGYGYRMSESPDLQTGPRETHNLNVGVSYSRALSFSRRTSFAFSTGSAILVNDDLAVAGTDPRMRFRLLGNATLNHEIGRTWTAQAAYSRGFVFREGFDDPFFTDAVSASVGGFVTRRLDLALLAHWSFATLDRPGNANNHDSVGASAQARYALTQFLALFARYVYYEYKFGENVPLDPDLARALDRHGVRVGITASLPLIR